LDGQPAAAAPDAARTDSAVPDAAGGDDAGSDAAGPDAPVADASSPCAWNTPFDSVSVIPELGGGAELRLSQDELTGYLYRTTGNATEPADVFVTHRTAIGAPFVMPVVAKEVNAPAFNGDPFLSFDGLSLYLNSDRPGTLGNTDIFVAQRADPMSMFSAAVPVANVNSSLYDGTPYVTDDGSELWLATSRAGSIDVYRAMAQGGGFGAASSVDGLNLPSSNENNPVLMHDGLTVYFSSNRSGPTSVYVAHRSSMTSPFVAPVLVPEISTTGVDYASWISEDGCRLYMTRGSPYMLYVARRR
jgi:hypothetical protein